MHTWQNGLLDSNDDFFEPVTHGLLPSERETLLKFAIETEFVWTWQRFMKKSIPMKLSNLFIMN